MLEPITANFSHYIIPGYDKGDCFKLERQLCVYDNVTHQSYAVGLVYDEEKKELRIPRGYSETKLAELTHRTVEVNDKPQKFQQMPIGLLRPPREKLQIEVISFLCGGSRKYAYTQKHSQVFCDLDTGKGKTYCASAAMAYFQHKTIITTPSRISKLKDQWKEGILAATDKDKNSILIVDGSKMCMHILEGKYEHIDIFIFSRATILAFAKKYGWPKFQEVVEATHAGMKIVDETHLDFATNVKIDCYTNVKRNIYLTSSAGRSSEEENAVFQRVFRSVPILGKEFHATEENYMMMFMFTFHHHPSTRQRIACKTKKGLSAVLYSKYLFDPDGAKYEFFTALDTALQKIFVKYKDETGKLLILCSTVDLIHNIARFLEKNYDQYSVGVYTGETPKKQREVELSKDIILATDKGIGTGADIEDLQMMINTISYSSDIWADQLSGRLRNNGKQIFYMEIVNAEFAEAYAQYLKRVPFLGRKAKGGNIITVDVR